MKIGNNNFISFGARHVCDTKIKKFNRETGKYDDKSVSLVELDAADKNDVKVLDDISYSWDNSYFAPVISDDVMKYNDNEGCLFSNLKLYALTTQQENYKNLDKKKILGISECEEENTRHKNGLYIMYLEVNPAERQNPYSEHKKIGSGFLDALKSKYMYISLQSVPSESVHRFYRSNGFKASGEMKNGFYWKI